MVESFNLLAAFSIGFLGSLHCIGMCGGISAALGQSLGGAGQQRLSHRITYQLLFSGGRIGSYMLAGFLAASLGEGFRELLGGYAGALLRGFAGAMMVALGLYIAGVWRGLTRLEQLGGHLWKHLSPYTKRLLPVTHPVQALALGALWGWLPCGLVYSALSWSIAAPSPVIGALSMGYFGLGTLPALLGVGLFSGVVQASLRSATVRQIAGLLLVAFGLWTALFPLFGHDGHGDPSGHPHHMHGG